VGAAAQRLGKRVQPVGTPRNQNHRIAAPGELARDLFADARRCAGDEHRPGL
jgi:hypothetical protein